jgi:hypothetical protein
MEAIDTTTGYVMQQGSKERQTVSLGHMQGKAKNGRTGQVAACHAFRDFSGIDL